MKANDNHNKEWEEELKSAPGLLNRVDRQPFEAPPGYFDSLASNIMDKITATETGTMQAVVRPLFTFKRLLLPSLAVAAVLLALFIFGRMRNSESKLVAMNYDDIYNTGLVSDLDESLLVDALTEETPSSVQAGSIDIDNYLIDCSTEESLINNL